MNEVYVILTEAQVLFLQKLYRKRINLWASAFGASLISYSGIWFNKYRQIMSFRHEANTIHQEQKWYLMAYVVVFVFVSACFLIAYRLKIHALRMDIKNKSGLAIPLTIQRMSHFPYVNTYFLFFDSDSIPNKEVNELEFSRCHEGEAYVVIRSARSNILIDEFENYELF
jgi:hypothetical protein